MSYRKDCGKGERMQLLAIQRGVLPYSGPYTALTARLPFTSYCLFIHITLADAPRSRASLPPGTITLPNAFSFSLRRLEVLAWPFKDCRLSVEGSHGEFSNER